MSSTGLTRQYWSDSSYVDFNIPQALCSVTIAGDTIPDYAFNNCAMLTSVSLSIHIASIGKKAFLGCTKLTDVYYGNSEDDRDNIAIADDNEPLLEAVWHYSKFSGACGENLTWLLDTDTNELTITGTGDMADFKNSAPWYSMRNAIKTVKISNGVTSIGSAAFFGCGKLVNIEIPDSVASIGSTAFAGCEKLVNIEIPNSVTSIGYYAFSSCVNLPNITIPNSVNTIGKGAFSGCTSLANITVEANNARFSSVEGILYNKEKTELLCYPRGKEDTAFTVPCSVTHIGEGAFSSCAHLANITIPNSVKSIGSEAFYNCANLVTFDISDSVTSISDYTFMGCTSLESVAIPNSVTSIGDYAFYNCTALMDVYYYGSVNMRNDMSFGGGNDFLSNANWHYNDPGPHHIHNYKLSGIKQPACNEEGVLAYTCSCGDSYTETVEKDASNHIGGTEIHNANVATCSAAGYTGDTYCKGCGVKLQSGTAIAKTEHTWNAGSVTTKATCTVTGVKTFTCTLCGTTKTESLSKDANNHTGGTELRESKMATCSAEGYTGDTFCKGCGVKLLCGTVIAKLAHTWNSGSVTTAASCITTGVKTFTCTTCNETKTEELPTLGHDYRSVVTPPTATSQGYSTYTCTRCGDSYKDAFTAPLPSIAIHSFVSSHNVDYRTTITFSADVTNRVSGASVHWFIDGQDKGANDTYTMKEVKKDFTVQAKYVKDGKVLADSEIETVTVNVGFFTRLKAFFRALFGRLPKVVQEYLGVEIIDRVLP